MATLSEITRTFDENGIYVAARKYILDPNLYVYVEIDDYCGWSYKFFLKNIDEDDHYELKYLELLVCLRTYKKLDNDLIKKVVETIAANKDKRRKEELLIEKDVDGEDYPSYLSSKIDGLDFLINYLG